LYELSFPYELEPEKIVNVKYIKVVYDEKDKDKYKDYDLYYFEEFSPPKDVLYSYEKFDKAMEVLWYTLNEDGIYKRKLYIEKLKRKVAHLQDNLTGKMYYKKFEFEKTPKDQKVNFIVRSKV
jgi:hypothetical protein